MSDQLIPIETIKRRARESAERGELPSACPYQPGTDAEFHWKDAYYLHVHRLGQAGKVVA